MKSKLLFLVVLYLSFGFYSSCCKAIIPYFDFKSINIETEKMLNINEIVGTQFTLTLDSIEFLSNSSYGFNNAFAMQPCPNDGSKGLKKEISRFNVTCNLPYFDTIAAGSNLNEYLYINKIDEIVKSDDLVGVINESIYRYRGPNYRLPTVILYKNNLTDTVHVFTFEIIKSNGEIVKANTIVDNW